MPDYAAFFLNSATSVVHLETLEISHPNFTKTHWIVRNSAEGLTATLETGAQATFTYLPVRIRPTGSGDDLDQILQVDLGDLGEVIPVELDAVAEAEGFSIKPTVLYRAYRSDDLTAPMFGPLRLEVHNLSSNQGGSSFEARAPALNLNRTGELYRLERFPMLRGYM